MNQFNVKYSFNVRFLKHLSLVIPHYIFYFIDGTKSI